MAIIFHNGELIMQDGGSAFVGFIINVTGAAIGALSALAIYLHQTNREKIKKNKEDHEKDINNLRYFASLLNKSLETINNQINLSIDFSDNLKNKYNSTLSMEQYDDTALRRITQVIDQEKVYHSFLKINDIKVENKYTAFEELYTYLDFFHSDSKLLFSTIDEADRLMLDIKQQYKTGAHQFLLGLSAYREYLKNSNIPITLDTYDKLEPILEKFTTNASTEDISMYQNHLTLPILKVLMDIKFDTQSRNIFEKARALNQLSLDLEYQAKSLSAHIQQRMTIWSSHEQKLKHLSNPIVEFHKALNNLQ